MSKPKLLSFILFLAIFLSFRVQGQETITDGVYIIKSSSSLMALNIMNSSIYDNANLVQNPVDLNTISQKFYVKTFPDPSNFSFIINFNSKKTLEANDIAPSQITQWTHLGTPTQQWFLIPDGLGNYSIQNLGTGQYAQINGSKEGAPVILADFDSEDLNQKFTFEKILENGVYEIQSKSSGLLWEVDPYSMLIQNAATHAPNQRFYLNRADYENTYFLTPIHTLQAIGVAAGSTPDEYQILQQPVDGQTTQQWLIRRNSDGYFTIQSVSTQKYADVSSLDAGAPIEARNESANSDGQQFDFIRIFDVPVKDFSNYAYVCTHNSHVAKDEGWSVDYSQNGGLNTQMSAGVRTFLVDTHYVECCDRHIDESGVYLLHGADKTGITGLNYPVGNAKRLYTELQQMVDFLNANTYEIIVLFIEDYAGAANLQLEMARVIGLTNVLYNPDNDRLLKISSDKKWPLLSDMIATNRRLIIFSDENYANTGFNLVAWDYLYTKQNDWEAINRDGTLNHCLSRWDDGLYIDHYKAEPLFQMSHFRSYPQERDAEDDNQVAKIYAKINQCLEMTLQYPNFVCVNFYEKPGTDNTFTAVSMLNQQGVGPRPW